MQLWFLLQSFNILLAQFFCALDETSSGTTRNNYGLQTFGFGNQDSYLVSNLKSYSTIKLDLDLIPYPLMSFLFFLDKTVNCTFWHGVLIDSFVKTLGFCVIQTNFFNKSIQNFLVHFNHLVFYFCRMNFHFNP